MSCQSNSGHALTKVCTKCGEEKHLMEFYLDYRKGRRLAQCKECMRAYQRAYYAASRERCRGWARRGGVAVRGGGGRRGGGSAVRRWRV